MKTLLIGSASLAALSAIPAFAQVPPAAPAAPVAASPQVRITHMANKTQTRAEVAAKVREHFARIDSDRDGFITQAESDAVRQRMGGMMGGMGRERLAERLAGKGERRIGVPPNHIDRSAMFDRLDTNKDGSISRQEFLAAKPHVHERRVVMMRDGPRGAGKLGMGPMMGGFHGRMFEMADVNKDNRVSLQEATDAALRRFDAADLNRDGQLTPEERRQSRQQRRSSRG